MKSPWHDTQSQALDAGFAELRASGAVISEERETEVRSMFGDGGQRYSESKWLDVPLESLKGKPTKKYGHITLYRSETGRYEVTTYIL